MVINKGFSIKLCGDLDFEGMIIDIDFNDQPIAMLNYEKGVDQMEIELVLCNENIHSLIFSLSEFLDVLEKAKKLAIQCAEEDRLRESQNEE